MIQAEMKITLSEIKKNLQEINIGMNEAKNQINDLKHKEEKNSIRITRRKKKSKETPTQGYDKEPLGQLQTYQHSNHKGARRRRERARN